MYSSYRKYAYSIVFLSIFGVLIHGIYDRLTGDVRWKAATPFDKAIGVHHVLSYLMLRSVQAAAKVLWLGHSQS